MTDGARVCECGEPEWAGIHDSIRTWVSDPDRLHAFRLPPRPSLTEPPTTPVTVADIPPGGGRPDLDPNPTVASQAASG